MDLPAAMERIQGDVFDVAQCLLWYVGCGQNMKTSRMCCGVHSTEVEEETCSARAKEA